MTKLQREKSVAIARDVLKNLSKMDVSNGNGYFLTKQFDAKDGGKQLQDLLPKLLPVRRSVNKRCSVCALGACFLAHVGLFNKFKLQKNVIGNSDDNGTYLDSCDIAPALKSSMGMENMLLIESAFEGSDLSHSATYRGNVNLPSDLVDEAIEFGDRFQDPQKRLKAILENLIKNNGEFMAGKKLLAREREQHSWAASQD